MGARTDRIARIASATAAVCLLAVACKAPADDGGWNPRALAARRADPSAKPEAPRRDLPTRRALAEPIRYDVFCARRDPLPRRLVAVSDGTRVVVVSETGTEIARIPGGAPVRWSASGRLLAVGSRGALWSWDGKRYEGPDVPLELGGAGARWAWSPGGDCALVLADGRLEAFHTGAGANVAMLVPRGVESAAWGPGGRVAVLLRERSRRSLWIADLRGSGMRRVVAFPPDICCVVLGGWAPGGRDVLFWAGPGTSVMQDGWRLESVDARGTRRTWGRTLPRPDVIAPCGEALAALTGGDRTLRRSTISLLRPDRPPLAVAGPDRFSGLSCSATGSFVASTGPAGLRFSFADGSETTPLGPALPRVAPEWGPPGSGVLFLGEAGPGTQVWFVAEGATAPRSIVELPRTPERPPRQILDWTGTPPTGLFWGSF